MRGEHADGPEPAAHEPSAFQGFSLRPPVTHLLSNISANNSLSLHIFTTRLAF